MPDMKPTRPTPSGAPEIDPERLAALLEGKVSDAERAELLARLEASPELLEAFSDAVAVRDDIAAESVVSLHQQKRSAWNPRLLAAIAAAAAVVLVTWPLVRESRPGILPGPAMLVAALPPGAPTVPADPGWRTTRAGTGVTGDLDARAVRVGAYLVELNMRAAAGDTLAGAVAVAIANQLADVPAAAAVERAFRDLAVTPSPSAIASAEAMVEAVLGSATVRAGAWLQAARVAALEQRAAFFTDGASERAVAELERHGSPGSRREILDDLVRLTGAETHDWSALANVLSRALLVFGD